MLGRKHIFVAGLFFSLAYLGLSGASAYAARIDIKANGQDALTVSPGTSVTLSWITTQVTSCEATEGWSGAKAINGSQSMGVITSDKTYKLVCRVAGTFFSDTVKVTVGNINPTVSLKANSTLNSITVPYDTPVTLTHTSTNATSCTSSGAWSGAKSISGTQSLGKMRVTSTYTITCTGPTGNASSTVTVNVLPFPAPTADLRANNTSYSVSVPYNTGATLSWTSTNASNACTASNGWSGAKNTSGSESTGPLTATKTYTITCTGTGGSISSSVTVTVTAPPAPTVDIKANNNNGPLTVASGSAATLTWSSTNATSCTAANGWSGAKALNGSESAVNIAASRVYVLTCTGGGGSASDSVTVSVTPPPAPTVSIKANNTLGSVSVPYNTAATIAWTSTNATSCVASSGFTGTKAINGSDSTGNLTATKTYTITCTGTGGSTSSSVTVNIASASAPTVSIRAGGIVGTLTIPHNAGTTLLWTSANATSCVASSGWSGAKALNGSESKVNLTASKTYVITCTGSGGSSSSSVTVNVTPAVTPTLILKANNTISSISIPYNTGATLAWPTTDATSCWASGDWSGWKTIGSSESTGNLSVSKIYKLQCWSASGVETPVSAVTINVIPPLAPTVDIKANTSNGPLSITSGASATLSWTSANATTCTASNGFTGTKAISGSESTGALAVSKTYTITCTGTGGSITDSVTVNVNSPANDKPSAVARVGIDGSPFSSTVTVIRGVPATLTLDASASSDPDGWATPGTGVSQGGKCEWNSDLNTGTASYEKVVSNPASPSACNTSLGAITFNDAPGTYTYNVLRVTDSAGAVSKSATIGVTVVSPVGSQAPVVVARFIVNGGAPSSSITVTRGVPVTVSLDASASSDPDGWTTPGTGVSQGGKCEWNTTLDQSKPASFKQIVINPATPAACNISLGTLTFNDAPGTYSYTLLRITDASGSGSVARVFDTKTNELFAKLFPLISSAHAAIAETSVSVTVVE